MQRVATILESGEVDVSTYKDLCNLTLARVIIFNAKRGGEAGRMLLTDFDRIDKDTKSEMQDIEWSPVEKKLHDR